MRLYKLVSRGHAAKISQESKDMYGSAPSAEAKQAKKSELPFSAAQFRPERKVSGSGRACGPIHGLEGWPAALAMDIGRRCARYSYIM